jgi:hypothetical protein
MELLIELIRAMRLASAHSMRLLAKLPQDFTDKDILKAAREIVEEYNAPSK